MIVVTADGRYSDANAAALELLGVTLDELRASSPGRFASEPSDPEADAAFRAQWEASGRPDVGGATTILRTDGTRARVKFAIRQMDDGSYTVLLTPVPDSPQAPTAVYTAGEVLAAWRAAERRLEALTEDASERHEILEDIAEFRRRYQLLFQRGSTGSDARTA
jgi:PAS domain S-box-containing protein